MARRRMFSLDIVDTDLFLDMPATSQNLYFHLGMHADDDGFIANPRKITKAVNCGNDDLNVLISRGFVIPFENGIVVIRHWLQNNYIRSDRYTPTLYTAEKERLTVNESNVYELTEKGIPDVNQMVDERDTQGSIGEDRIGKDKEYSSNFTEFWTVYPRKKEKSRAYKCYQARLKDGYSEEELLTAATEYAKECRQNKTEVKYIKLPSTFLSNSTPFVDYLEKGGQQDEPAENTGNASDSYGKYLG